MVYVANQSNKTECMVFQRRFNIEIIHGSLIIFFYITRDGILINITDESQKN